MILLDSKPVATFCLLLVSFGLLSSCAIAPAKIERRGYGRVCPLRGRPLEALLEQALKKDQPEESAHAIAHFVEQWKETRGGSDEGEVIVGDSGNVARHYHIEFGNVGTSSYLDYFDQIIPAADLQVKKIAHYRRIGVGAPLVAVRENRGREAIETFYPPEAIVRPLTAVMEVGRKRKNVQNIRIDLLNPLNVDRVRRRGKSMKLAADLSAPWAALLAKGAELHRSRISDFLNPNPKREPRLYLMEAYDPNKEPLIMIHGLLSSPLVWARLSNQLWADEEIRERYQIWHYLYNTSAPALYSGRILRRQLRELRPMLDPNMRDPAMQSTTIIAHSMGGLVTRSLTTRPGNAFWDVAFTQSFDSLVLDKKDRDALHEAFLWEPEQHVKRVIYLAVPHRGSDLADNFFGRLGHWLAKPPKEFASFYERVSKANPRAFTPAYAELGAGKLDSVHALSPSQPTLSILADLPNHHVVREFSIIGDRGEPGALINSSDGIVTYTSSHREQVESEAVYPTGHSGITKLPAAVAEIKRILKLK